MMAVLFAFALASPPQGPDSTAGRPCQVVIDSVGGNYHEIQVRPGEKNSYAGGGVLVHCRGTGSTLSADSVALFGGIQRFDMVGHVKILDTALTLDANTASYYLHEERLEAHNHVVAVNRQNGSVLRGPNLTYYRAVAGVRDTMEMYATTRPTIEYREAGAADSVEPYVIVADRVRFKGNDRMWAGGRTTVDRSDLSTRSDSIALDQTAGTGVLVGNPRVQGKGAQTYTLVGTRIELGFQNHEITLVKALGQGTATGQDWQLTADTIHMALAARKLQRVFAWGKQSRPHAVSALHTIQADSLALDVPDQVLTEVRAFGKAYSSSRRDTVKHKEIDWIAGDSLTAHWIQAKDSAGTAKATLDRLLARGAARALTHLYDDKDSTAAPSLNYTRGTRILITMQGDKIDHVISDKADGVQLEPKPPAPPPADTTKHSGRP